MLCTDKSCFLVKANSCTSGLSFTLIWKSALAATPVDFWKLSDSFLEPQSAHSFSLGYYRNFKDNQWATSIEGYFKTLQNVPEYKDFPDLIVNNYLETELLPAEGQNYGVEVSIKKNVGRVTGRLSYTWARSLRLVESEIAEKEINNGDWFPSNFDKPHSLDFVFNYNFSQRFKSNWWGGCTNTFSIKCWLYFSEWLEKN